MITFNGEQVRKTTYLACAQAIRPRIAAVGSGYQRAPFFFTQSQWCANGCIVKDGGACDHSFYASELGVPVAVAYAERALFLELPTEQAPDWPERFVRALPVGVDLEPAHIIKDLALYVLADRKHGLITFAQNAEQVLVLSRIAELYRSDCQDAAQWKDAADQAAAIYRKSPGGGARTEPHEAMAYCGVKACYSAMHFAQAFEDPRQLVTAISWMGWPAQYRRYSEIMSSQPDPRKNTRVWDDRGIKMANVGESLWNHGLWVRQSDAAYAKGRELRDAHTIRVANLFLRLVKASAPGNAVTRLIGEVLRRAA